MEEIKDKNILVGVMPDPRDERDYKYKQVARSSQLPKKVDLRKWSGEIENQLDTGSCVANATVSALELQAAKEGKNLDLSRLFVYWNVREPYPELRAKDRGSYLRDGFKMVNKYGVPSEDVWEFEKKNVNVKPPQEAYEKAKENKVLEYRRISHRDINAIKDALNNGYPVTFSTAVGKKFIYLNGPLKYQKYGPVNNWSNKLIGYHAMTLVGYDDDLKAFIVENSWSEAWGDNGYGVFPYLAMIRDGIDCWVATKCEFKSSSNKDTNDENTNDDKDTNDETFNSFNDDEIKILKEIIKFFKAVKGFFTKD